jgi:asparagine synthase (glutamine-hydrolysing)
MCGIGGLILTPPGPIKPEWMHAFSQDLAHRGPDNSGWLSMHRGTICQCRDVQDDLVAESLLIHRRLSILDLTEAGHQPMGTPDGRYRITFNGNCLRPRSR